MIAARPSRKFSKISLLTWAAAMLLAVAPAAASCGDGVIDGSEACDDGSSNGTANSCCTTLCQFTNKSPDVIVGDLVGTTTFTAVGGITAYAVGTTSCNEGSCWLQWFGSTADHPIIGQNMYRLKDGRFEQIGQSWLKHGFTALQGTVCHSDCNQSPNGSHLGVHCSDPYSNSLNGTQSNMGPKDDVNPNTGVYLYPDSRISTTGNSIFKRLQVHNTDLDAASNPGALYFVEGQYIAHDDASFKNQNNNASYRPVTVGASPYNLTLTGSTVRQKAGIQAWKAQDATVTETIVGAPEGEFIVSAKATSLGGGQYHYEYAVQNLNNQRAGQSFSVPLPPGTTVTNTGFHDVDYHSGDPYDGTDWPATVTSTSVSWATTTYDVNQNANALRWGTLYNFRFDANQPPGSSAVTLGLFRPGVQTSVAFTTVTPGVCGGSPDGTACTDNSACTVGDSCSGGACVPGTPVVCAPADQCHDAGVCQPASGTCTNPAKPNGSACSDGSLCTQTDTCQSGACVGSSPVVCAPLDACHTAGSCNPANGACSNPIAPNGSPCNDGNACTQTDTCVSGTCTGGNAVVCSASDQCHSTGICDSGTGVCSNPQKQDGSSCTDGSVCTQGDSCQSGACQPGAPVTCSAIDTCHGAGTCDSVTGCSNPVLPDGTPCDDGNACTTGDACASGVCSGVGGQAPSEVDNGVQVAIVNSVATISWDAAVGSTWSNVIRGLVSGLPVGPGGADEVCLDNGMTATATTDPQDPPPDEAFWYLVQGTNGCGRGSFGFQTQNGVPTVERTSATCP